MRPDFEKDGVKYVPPEMSKTKELRERIEVKINRFDTFGEEYSYATFAEEILQACKESGLTFPDGSEIEPKED